MIFVVWPHFTLIISIKFLQIYLLFQNLEHAVPSVCSVLLFFWSFPTHLNHFRLSFYSEVKYHTFKKMSMTPPSYIQEHSFLTLWHPVNIWLPYQISHCVIFAIQLASHVYEAKSRRLCFLHPDTPPCFTIWLMFIKLSLLNVVGEFKPT